MLLLAALLPTALALRAARLPPTRRVPLHPIMCSGSSASGSAAATAEPFTPNGPRDGGKIAEPAALWALDRMLRADVRIETSELQASIPTTFIRPQPAKDVDRPLALFLHGADFSCLEWRFVMQDLIDAGIDCAAVDWYSGGWTEREQLNRRLEQGGVQPWTLVRQHLLAFWEQQLGGRPIVLVGASLGGAVALDFAATHPEAVAKLVLIDAGGESFKAPPPDTVAALAAPVLAVKGFFQGVQARLPDDQSRIVSLHRGQPGCYDASLLYLKSGSMARRVGRELIRTVAQPTLVVWGVEDDILPLSDAYAFERDLQRCVGVREVVGSGHSPHLDNPAPVVTQLKEFIQAES